MNELVLRIARCQAVDQSRVDEAHPCHRVVAAQGVAPGAFHLPEPWNGDIRSAPLLFVSSNPAIGPGEDYPTSSWPDSLIADYFTNRFGGGAREWTKNACRGLRTDGTYGSTSPFWTAIRARARELFDREVVPGRDFALTEVVHCKSSQEVGVRESEAFCSDRYLLAVLGLSGAVVIVALGRTAERHLRRLGRFEGALSEAVTVAGKRRRVVVLPHPNARKDRTLAKCFDPEDVEILRAELRAGSGELEFS